MIEFRALGPAQLVGPPGTDTQAVLARPKLLGLLAYLSAAGSRGFHRRDSLIGCFWPELTQDRARSAVRQSLYRLRQFLGEAVVVTRGDEEVSVAEEAFWCDVVAFEEALARGDRAGALQLYRGDLLEGLYVPDAPEFERWLDERRKDLRQRASMAAWELADEEAGLRHTAEAGRWSRQARNLAPLDERMLRRVIKLLDRLGDRAGAVREYETFARRLALELELEPSPESKALIGRIRERSEAVASAVGLAATRQPTLTGTLADRYHLDVEIGSGSMATVYRARDLRHNRDVAVKVMHPSQANQMGAERFLREITIAANLNHPHIVPVFDSGSTDGHLYFVMPLIQGESLRDRLEREGQLPIDEALQYAREVAEALDHAHRQGVVHRDVKPENILLSGGHALVADFGIARATSAAASTRLTGTGMVMGTPFYMSPEQAGSGDADHRSDVYSLACVLYEMLAGQPPFTGPTIESIARQHLTTAPRPITELRSTVPEHVSLALTKALAKTPADRFSQASQFVHALFSPEATRPRVTRRNVARLVAVAAVLAVGTAAVLRWTGTSADQTPALDPNRVVVVPFENRTGDTTLALLGNMAADWVAQGLQEIEVIDVVPTATSIAPGPDVPRIPDTAAMGTARSVGQATRAGTVIAGAYYRRGDSLEFQAQIIDANQERLLRAVAPVTGSTRAASAVLDSLRGRVVTTVAAALDHRLFGSSTVSHPPSLEAYRAYLEGLSAFYYAGPQRMDEVLTFMYQAVALDSLFPHPRFFLVMAHMNLGQMRAADSNAALLIPFRPRFSPYERAFLDWLVTNLRGDRAGALRAARARGAAWDIAVEALRSNRAYESIEILSGVGEPENPEFYFKWHALMEALHMVGDYSGELTQARRAREIYPDRRLMLGNELRALAALGRIEDVFRGLDQSLLLPSQGELAVGDLMLSVAAELRAHGHTAASHRAAERAVAWFDSRPDDEAAAVPARVGRAMALYLAERWQTAETIFQEVAAGSPRDLNVQGYLGVLAARRGDRGEARRISAHLTSLADPYDFGRDVYWQACIAAQLRELDRAMVLLREAYDRGRSFDLQLHRDIDLEPLHGYPPFEEFLAPKR
ncbi:MAG: protein kinase [Gemmatimonadota bacterium]|nr:protein kinase [Gemmatimonadota bacterium]